MNLRTSTLLIAWMPLVLTAGCGSGDDGFREFSDADNVENTNPPDVHPHPEHGPHEGHLVELGGEDYHAEIVFDHDARVLTVYLLGSDAASAMPIDTETVTLNLLVDEAPMILELPAAPLDGETEGSSRFTVAGDVIPEAIRDEEDLEGSISVMIEGTQYRHEIGHEHGGHDAPADGSAPGEQ